jgi:hypothetical protein
MDAITKNAAISAAILAKTQAGTSLSEAIDAVLGAGTYARLAGDIYESLRTKQGSGAR